MSMKKVIYFIYSIMISFVCLGVVNAVNAPTITADKDYITAYSQGASLYYYSTSSDFKTAVSMSSTISLRNGTYYFWARGTGVGDGNLSAAGPTKYVVTTSCSNQSKLNAVGQGTVERCMIVDSNGNFKADSNQAIVKCASGYKLKNNSAPVTYNGCSNLRIPVGGMRFCKVVYSYECVATSSNPTPPNPDPTPTPPPQPEVPAAVLTSLNVEGYSISPAFSSSNRSYSVSVGSGVTSVNINATLGSGANYVSGYGPRSVNLNYGNNSVAVKVQNSVGSVTVYTININRADGRNSDNTLKSLSVDKGEFTPKFDPNTTYYSMKIAEKDQEVKISAELNNSSASFVEGYGPRTVKLALGVNTLYVKVKNERGNVKVYTINIVSGTGTSSTECSLTSEELPTLKEIVFSTSVKDVELPQIENFDSALFQYNGIKIPYEVKDLEVEAFTTHEGDTYTVEGHESLEVNVPTNIVIKVTSKACPTTTIEYNIEVTRQAEGQVSGNSNLKDISIKSKDGKTTYDIDFEQNKTLYKITVNKGEKGLVVEGITEDPNATVVTKYPDTFRKGATYVVTVTSQDGMSISEYKIEVAKIKSGANVFIIAIVIIILIIFLIYGVLRLLGYRIYFNTAMLGAFFRGMGSKDKFDK